MPFDKWTLSISTVEEIGIDNSEPLKQYFITNGIQEDTKKVHCFRGRSLMNLYTISLLQQSQHQRNTRTHIVDVMIEHLWPKPLIIAKQFKLHKRNQASMETVSQYLAELQRLAD